RVLCSVSGIFLVCPFCPPPPTLPPPFSFTDTAPPEPSPLSLHDALPISTAIFDLEFPGGLIANCATSVTRNMNHLRVDCEKGWRSEEHTSELQSRENLVCRLLLEKKNNESRSNMQQPKLDREEPVHPPRN